MQKSNFIRRPFYARQIKARLGFSKDENFGQYFPHLGGQRLLEKKPGKTLLAKREPGIYQFLRPKICQKSAMRQADYRIFFACGQIGQRFSHAVKRQWVAKNRFISEIKVNDPLFLLPLMRGRLSRGLDSS